MWRLRREKLKQRLVHSMFLISIEAHFHTFLILSVIYIRYSRLLFRIRFCRGLEKCSIVYGAHVKRYICALIIEDFKDCQPNGVHVSAEWEVSWGLRRCGKLQAGLKNCPGLGLLIVSSVLAKSAGCDSRPLSVARWPLDLASSPLTCPITASTVSLSSPHSHLNAFAARMRISASVSKRRR